jgi:hypothetical protein
MTGGGQEGRLQDSPERVGHTSGVPCHISVAVWEMLATAGIKAGNTDIPV